MAIKVYVLIILSIVDAEEL